MEYKMLTIKEAKYKLEKCENDLDYWINKKNIMINQATLKASAPAEERVNGGTRVDKFAKIDYTIDEIDPNIEYLNQEITILHNFIEKSLRTLGKYEPLEKKIIELRENGMKWDDIASEVHYSERQCRRIYSKYFKRRSSQDVL